MQAENAPYTPICWFLTPDGWVFFVEVMQHLEQIVKFVNSHDCGIDNRARIVGDLVRIESVEVDSARNPTIVVNFVKSIREARAVLGY